MTIDDFDIQLGKLVVEAAKDNQIERIYGAITVMEVQLRAAMIRNWHRQEQEITNPPTKPEA